MKRIYVLGVLVFICLIIAGGYVAFQTVTVRSQLHAFEEKYQLQNILSDPLLYGKDRCRTSHNSIDLSKCPAVVYSISVSQAQEVKKIMNSSYKVDYPDTYNPYLDEYHEYQVPFDFHSSTDFNAWNIQIHPVNPDSVYPYYRVEITLSPQ